MNYNNDDVLSTNLSRERESRVSKCKKLEEIDREIAHLLSEKQNVEKKLENDPFHFYIKCKFVQNWLSHDVGTLTIFEPTLSSEQSTVKFSGKINFMAFGYDGTKFYSDEKGAEWEYYPKSSTSGAKGKSPVKRRKQDYEMIVQLFDRMVEGKIAFEDGTSLSPLNVIFMNYAVFLEKTQGYKYAK